MKKSPFGAYDIRGVYGENITDDFAYSLGNALSKYLGAGKLIAVGHDSRLSSPALSEALIAGIEAAGGKAERLGLASTPRVYWHGAQERFAGSVAVTASHLAAKHNGFKICREKAIPISSEDGLLDIKALMSADQTSNNRSAAKHEPAFVTNGLTEYISQFSSSIKVGRKLKLIIDVGGSPVGEEIDMLLENDLLENELIDSQPDGNFSRRSPNPMDEGALDHLISRVRENNADFGVAFDGDGDRIVFVDEQGAIIAPDLVTALLSKQVLHKNPGAKIMYDLRSSRAVPEFIEQNGGTALKCRVGHSFIKADMRRQNIALAGELSSHYYWSELAYTDNAVKTLIEFINLVSNQTAAVSALIEPLNIYANSGELNFRCENVDHALEQIQRKYSDASLDFTDGVTAEYPQWWFNARASHTEPLLRLCIGAQKDSLLTEKKDELSQIIASLSKLPDTNN